MYIDITSLGIRNTKLENMIKILLEKLNLIKPQKPKLVISDVINSCPHCNDGNLLKASPNLVAKDGYFICDKCYATKVVGIDGWVRPTKKVLYLDKITNHPIFEL